MLKKLLKKDKKLGVAQNKGRYDLPLNQSAGSHFLILLVALMTFLAMMAICASFVLGGVSKRWSSGLENKLTIEIPALTSEKKIRTKAEIKALSDSVANRLKGRVTVQSFEVQNDEDISALVSPWLGDDVVLDDIPLPGLISVELTERTPQNLGRLQNDLQKIAADIRVDTHESWLAGILRLAHTMKLSSILVTLVILLTTIIAIAGAVRSRMAEHKADIELLHLMGASDIYITKQLQRHAIILTLKGALFGFVLGAALLFLLSLGGNTDSAVMGDYSLNIIQGLILIALPFFISMIASQAARFTVLRVLGQMP